jgi:hypothetical protein
MGPIKISKSAWYFGYHIAAIASAVLATKPRRAINPGIMAMMMIARSTGTTHVPCSIFCPQAWMFANSFWYMFLRMGLRCEALKRLLRSE